ncbi:hypothetical protein NUV25_15470 [Burkholderia pseudomultivorans]|uniref:hypothetical protein n=1 Tax=Burkholderia pseudomultivorans TaxID=1207504 RepID=UPI001184B38C|nr:hypothetical protein [Burkholderia pseudomultivorans]MDS0859105.1 hypothetical protein [Burkholderia pseudomultivorans]
MSREHFDSSTCRRRSPLARFDRTTLAARGAASGFGHSHVRFIGKQTLAILFGMARRDSRAGRRRDGSSDQYIPSIRKTIHIGEIFGMTTGGMYAETK